MAARPDPEPLAQSSSGMRGPVAPKFTSHSERTKAHATADDAYYGTPARVLGPLALVVQLELVELAVGSSVEDLC
jgi:hypothetical protein